MTDPAIEVTTDAGAVRGTRIGDLLAWRGIPYAAAPVGTLRFRAPQPVDPWTDVRSAETFGPVAPQPRIRAGASEDCLTLNVVAPAAPSAAPRPVLVFIHGGAYVTGGSSEPIYQGNHLVERGDIVYVSLNYRLGALGYLDFSGFSTAQRPFDSNLGLRDQVAALEWVQRNIAVFGGDPSNVTLFGQSSGANAVTTLMCTPAAEGTFARAIAESPPAASVYGKRRARAWAAEFLEILGARAGDAVHALTNASPSDLVAATATLTARCTDEQPGTRATAPVVDGEFLPAHPLDVFAAGKAHRVPLIVGTNSHEGRYFPLFLDIIPTTRARIDKMFDQTPDDVKERAIAAYPGYPGRRAATDLGGDVVFWEPSILVAQGHSAAAPTYSYRYDFEPRLLRTVGLRATHGTELFAVFGVGSEGLARQSTLLGGRRGLRAVTDVVQSHWLHFVTHGEPEATWPRYTTDTRETLIIDEDTRVEADPLGDRRRAWIGYEHRR